VTVDTNSFFRREGIGNTDSDDVASEAKVMSDSHRLASDATVTGTIVARLVKLSKLLNDDDDDEEQEEDDNDKMVELARAIGFNRRVKG